MPSFFALNLSFFYFSEVTSKYNDLEKTTYPSGLVIKNTYSSDGYLFKVEQENGQMLFDGTDGVMSGFGKWRSYKLGNNIVSNVTYNNFAMPTRYQAYGKQDLVLDWGDLKTGNLVSRTDNIKGKTESFTYDNLNRLTEAHVQGLNSYGFNLENNGNIYYKSDAGYYFYDANKPNALSDIYYNTWFGGGTIPAAQQNITYTKFQRPDQITEGGYELSFLYASDYERRKTVLKQNGNVVNTRYFMSDYEIDIKNGTTTEIHYISGGDGLCAIVVKENGSFAFNFPYSDHLGSILTVTNASGAVIAEQNFDAWGRKRNVTTWDYANVGAVSDWLYRGFTGHEHLPEFGLINMNARLYDPVLGRMLSVDNHVGAGTQGLNRYSYAVNNPLNRIDPSGNDPIFTFPDYNAIASAAMTQVLASSNAAIANIMATNNAYFSSSLSSAMSGFSVSMANAQGYYFQGLSIASKYGIVNSSDAVLGWKPMYQNDLRNITDYYGMTGGIGYRFEELFQGYIQNGGTFGAYWDYFLDASSVRRNTTIFNGGGKGSQPDFTSESKYERFRRNDPKAGVGLETRRDAWYELKAWYYGSTIELFNPYISATPNVYQSQAHIDNLKSLFGNSAQGFTSYLMYLTPAGVDVSESVYTYGLMNNVYIGHLEAWYRQTWGGGYEWQLRGKPIISSTVKP